MKPSRSSARALAAGLIAAFACLGAAACAPGAAPQTVSAAPSGPAPSRASEADLGWEQRAYTVDASDQGEGPRELCLLVAASEGQQVVGLSSVDAVPRGADGMVFELESMPVRSFWMRGMRFGLDMTFVDAEGTVVAQVPMPVCDDDCPSYAAPDGAVLAIETPSGQLTLGSGASLQAGGSCG